MLVYESLNWQLLLQDEDTDYLRLFHGGWHLFVGERTTHDIEVERVDVCV